MNAENIFNGECPFCKSINIEGDSFDMDSCTAWQKVYCIDCNKEWKEIYTLSGVVTEDNIYPLSVSL